MTPKKQDHWDFFLHLSEWWTAAYYIHTPPKSGEVLLEAMILGHLFSP